MKKKEKFKISPKKSYFLKLSLFFLFFFFFFSFLLFVLLFLCSLSFVCLIPKIKHLHNRLCFSCFLFLWFLPVVLKGGTFQGMTKKKFFLVIAPKCFFFQTPNLYDFPIYKKFKTFYFFCPFWFRYFSTRGKKKRRERKRE